jgi:hypothetical protein
MFWNPEVWATFRPEQNADHAADNVARICLKRNSSYLLQTSDAVPDLQLWPGHIKQLFRTAAERSANVVVAAPLIKDNTKR